MTEQEIIWQHLTLYQKSSGHVAISTLMAGLRDAREACKRSVRTGNRNPSARGRHGSWLGTIGYLVLIDHIGKCFKLKGAPRTEKHAFRAALRIFGSLWDHQLNEAKISALYALRCALAHDYTLYNIPDKPAKHPDLIHHFGVCGAGSPFVTFSNTTWDMNLKNNISHDQETWINLERVQDLAEGMYRKLRTLAKTNDLEVNLNEGPEALRKHYILRF